MTIEPRAPAVFDDPSFGDPSFPLAVQAGSYKYKLINVESRSNGNIVLNILCNVDRDDSSSDEPSPIDNAYYTIQSEDGTKWATYYIYDWVTNEMSHDTSIYKVYSGGGKLSSSNTSDVFPEGSICWCIWCKEYYDSLVTQIGGSGNAVKVSQLEWDSNLTIPRGYSIESASSQVETNGNMWIGDSLAVEYTIECAELITSPQGTFTNLTVNGYTPKLIQSTGNVISYNGNPNTTIICATVPSGGVMCNGNATVEIFTTGNTTIRVYARCSSFGGKISDALLGSLTRPQTDSFTVSFANAKIPESTQFIMGFYATGDYNPTITNINITSASYASKQLI